MIFSSSKYDRDRGFCYIARVSSFGITGHDLVFGRKIMLYLLRSRATFFSPRKKASMPNLDRSSTWRGYVGLSLAWLAILGIVLLITRRPSAQPIEIVPPPTPLPTATPTATPTPRPLRIDVSGAVRTPGVYLLPADSIVADAIAAAGGGTEDAALDRVNKALPLQDGMQVFVPRRAEPGSAPLLINPSNTAAQPSDAANAMSPAGTSRRININTATAQELETLPGIGPAMAQRIIEGRPYHKIEDLLRVKGIGPATFEKLKEHITVQ